MASIKPLVQAPTNILFFLGGCYYDKAIFEWIFVLSFTVSENLISITINAFDYKRKIRDLVN